MNNGFLMIRVFILFSLLTKKIDFRIIKNDSKEYVKYFYGTYVLYILIGKEFSRIHH